MGFVREYKIGIITSLIASIVFLYLLEPLLKLFGRFVFGIAHSFYVGYLNRLFLKAALGTPPDPSLQLLFIFFGLLLGLLTGLLVGLCLSRNDKDIGTWSSERKLKAVLTGIIVSVLLISFHILWSTWFQFRLITSFDQHLRAIAPFISGQQEKTFKSRWTQMRTQKDYELIYDDLASLASSNSVALPKNLIYSLNDW